MSDSASINSPDLNPQTVQPQMRAIKDAAQAWEICKALEQENKERNKINARLMDKYNAERPFRQQALEAEGLGWKSNFSTKPLPQLIDKISPRFTEAIKSMRYITSAAFPENAPGASEKTEIFRKEITKVCRTREGWNDLWSEVSQENALFGFTSVSWQDEVHWFPKHFRQDAFFVPRGTKHYAGSAQLFIAREEYLLHELFQLIQNPAEAEIAGWNVENAVAAINSAQPDNKRSSHTGYERVYADLQRELSVSSSFIGGAKVVCAYHVFATEITGKITHYILEGTDGKELFYREDRYDQMSDVCALFSFQHGNGKIHGSKGIGREVYAMAAQLDRSRNEVVDRLQLSGKIIVNCEEKQIPRFRLSVLGNTILIGSQYQISQTQIDGDVKSFLELDAFFTELLDQIAGSTSPKALEGERVTKAAVELVASREEERKDAVISRFLSQFAKSMNTMQRRMCDPACEEPDAKAMQQRLLQHMTPEELAYIANQPAAETVSDYSEFERQQIVLIAQEGRGNPLYNQKELERQKLTAQISAEFADSVLLPDNDPTEEAEQARQQSLENILLQQGQLVPVSARDNFPIHFQALEPIVVAAAGLIAQSGDAAPAALPAYKAAIMHASDHLAIAQEQGVDKEQLKQAEAMVTEWQRSLQALEQEQQTLQQQQQPPAAPTPDGAPPANVVPFQ